MMVIGLSADVDPGFGNGGWEIKYCFNIWGIKKKRKKGAQKKGGENSPISPPLDPRLEWSPILSVIIWVFNKIGRLWGRSLICQSRVWLQTELDDTVFYYQLIITITMSHKSNNFIWKRAFNGSTTVSLETFTLLMVGLQCHAIKNKNHNYSIN